MSANPQKNKVPRTSTVPPLFIAGCVIVALLCLALLGLDRNLSVIVGGASFLVLMWLGVSERTRRRVEGIERAVRGLEDRLGEQLRGIVDDMKEHQKEQLEQLLDELTSREKQNRATLTSIDNKLLLITQTINSPQVEVADARAIAESILRKSESIEPLKNTATRILSNSERLLSWAEKQQDANEVLKIRKESLPSSTSDMPTAWSPEAFEKRILEKVGYLEQDSKEMRQLLSQLIPLLKGQKPQENRDVRREPPPLISTSTPSLDTWQSLMADTELEEAIKTQSDEWGAVKRAYEFCRGRWNELQQVPPLTWGAVDIERLDSSLYFQIEVSAASLPYPLNDRFSRLKESIRKVQEEQRNQLAQLGVSRIEKEASSTSADGMITGRVEADSNERLRPSPPNQSLEYKFYEIQPGKAGYEYDGKVIANKPTLALYYRRYTPQYVPEANE